MAARRKKPVKKVKKNLLPVLILIPLSVYLFLVVLKVSFKFIKWIEPVKCQLAGNQWFELYPGPTGCFKKYPDGGKSCKSGKECVSGVCTVGGLYFDKGKQLTENLTGTCPTNGPADGEFFLMCGSASIENGKVVEDMRNCMY